MDMNTGALSCCNIEWKGVFAGVGGDARTASPPVLNMWLQTVKFIAKKSKYADLAQQIGFSAPNSWSLPWLVKGTNRIDYIENLLISIYVMWIIAKQWTCLTNLSQVSLHNLKQGPTSFPKMKSPILVEMTNIECNSVTWVNLQIGN
jgi:hypothetical protein